MPQTQKKLTDEEVDRETEKLFPIAFRVYETVSLYVNKELLAVEDAPAPATGKGYPRLQVLLGTLLALKFLFHTMRDEKLWPTELRDVKNSCDTLIQILFSLIRDPRLPDGSRLQ